MHTNGGDRWIVIDCATQYEVDTYRSQMKAREAMNEANADGEMFMGKPRYRMVRWDEVTHEMIPITEV